MKKLFLSILVISSLLGGNAYAENIFDCEINTKDMPGNPVSAKLVIKVDNNSSARLKTGNNETGVFEDRDFILAVDGDRGDLIITSQFNFVKKGSYDLLVTQNAEKNDNSFFRALFSESSYNGLVHSLTITPWEENMPISFYLSDRPGSVIKGNCK